MIELFFEKLIEELGATGLLVIGLYYILHKPLNIMAKHIRTINHELGDLVAFLKTTKSKSEANHGKN